MKFLIVLFIIVTITAAFPIPAEDEISVNDSEWNDFKIKHNKSYTDSAEETRRREIYLDAKKKVIEHNKKYDAGEVTFQLGLNQFSDLTHDEFSEKVLRGHKKL